MDVYTVELIVQTYITLPEVFKRSLKRL